MATYNKIPGSMRIGPPTSGVRNIDAVLAFYENSLGLQAGRIRTGNRMSSLM
ncbi:MAG: hypothetical protein WBL88_07405 [Nitrososphaeraceae archaeon]